VNELQAIDKMNTSILNTNIALTKATGFASGLQLWRIVRPQHNSSRSEQKAKRAKPFQVNGPVFDGVHDRLDEISA